MAFSKKHKEKLVIDYTEWIKNSQAMYLASYSGVTMKAIDGLRAKARESGAEVHVVKNTLFTLAMKNAGIEYAAELMEGSTLIGFAVQDPPALAKVFADFSKGSDTVKIKGGFMGPQSLTPEEIKSLASLPSLPVMQAILLGTILAPASKLVRTLAEPARSLAAVVMAYSEKSAAPAAN
ncbi:MAG: 50S ribosomal protein L10 [Anaerolineaceae bacterium]|nr:50S ribosomal protein L10 [Anaerolineaceae bacterium]